MTITENQRRTLDLMAESIGWRWGDVEAMSHEAFREDVAGLSCQQANDLMRYMPKLGELTGNFDRPCDYVFERTVENAVPCSRCGAPAWDISYDVFLCDKHVAITDAGYNEALRREWSNRPVETVAVTGGDDDLPF